MRRLITVSLFAGLLTGCSFIPWHPFGTPLTAEKKAEAKVAEAETKIETVVQEEIHKFNYAVDAAVAGNAQGLPVAQQHGRNAQRLVDQVKGSPLIADETKWQELIGRQTSLDEKVRQEANQENSKRIQEVTRLSQDLETKSTALAEKTQEALAYAKEKERIADHFLKLCWFVGIAFGVYFLGQILQLLAHFNPAFGTAANVVNSIVSPALHASFYKARKAAAQALAPSS